MLLIFGALFTMNSCKDDEEPTLPDPPSAADAAFTYEATAQSDNIIEFTAANSSLTAKWDFGNGQTGEGTTVTAEYPNKGTYTVTLTVFNAGGSTSSSQDVEIKEDDLTLLDNPLYNMITGGVAGPGQKRWVIDSTRSAHIGVGPSETDADFANVGYSPGWWSVARLGKSTSGLYNDEYIFKLSGFGFDHVTGGEVFVKTGHEGEFPGAYANQDDFTAPFTDQLGETWTLTVGDEDTTLKISGDAFMGLYTGVHEYTVQTLTDSQMVLRYYDSKADNVIWYIRLVPDYYPVDQGSGNLDEPTTAAADPTASASDVISMFCGVYTDVTVDTWKTDWSVSGYSEVQVAGNDVKKYDNLGYVGIETVGANSIDASGMTHINFDVWTPNATEIKFKIVDFGADNAYDGGDDTEHEIVLATPNQKEWVHYSIPLSDFTNLTNRGHLSQYIFVGTPYEETVLYVDNVYFSK